jgi:hypothetical protein
MEINGRKCFVSARIVDDEYKVGYMYREAPDDTFDSGWRFLAGNETDEYINNANNIYLIDIEAIHKYDNDVLKYLDSDVGSSYIRINTNTFELDKKTKEIFVMKKEK